MAVPIDELIAKLPAERQRRIEEQGKLLVKEYKKLVEFRKDVGLTQKDLANRLSISQENISRLEKRQDMHLSTLRKYVEALGGKLELLITIPNEAHVDRVRALDI